MSVYAITGVAGFIGSHLADRLLREGRTIVGIDNFDPFYSFIDKQRNIDILSKNKNFKFFRCDIRSDDFELALTNLPVTHIIHLAARAGVRPSLRFPQSYVHHDIEGTVNLLQTAVNVNCENIVFGSSSSVYGNLPDLPYSEDLNLTQPISPYAAAKLSCELFNHVYHDQYNLNITNLRYFTVYGPRQRPEMGIHKFVRLLMKEKPIEMYGDGSSSRDYTFIDDIIDGTIAAIDKIGGFSTYNLGNGNPIILSDLITLIADKLKIEPKIIQKSMQPGDVTHTLADISKAKKDLGYNPKVNIKEGVEKFINWYKSFQI